MTGRTDAGDRSPDARVRADGRPSPGRPAAADLARHVGEVVPDLLPAHLRLLLVGINPSPWTAATGAHFARPGNRFYLALAAGGITPYVVDAAAGYRPADLDLLTGLGNRLAFTRVVEDRWQQRTQRPLSLILVDVDYFRRLNELYGRTAGDAALRELAARISRLKRRGDMVFRWGPGEFAVLLDQNQPRDLAATLDLYRQHLGTLEGQGLTLRTNIGGASTGPDIRTPADLIEAASRERYRMKYLREQREDYGLED